MGSVSLSVTCWLVNMDEVRAYLVAFQDAEKSRAGWCSKSAINFGRHYAIILADLLGM